MAKIGTLTISGKSGSRYKFDAYPLNTVWTPIGGVFIVTHRDMRFQDSTQHICLHLGQCGNMQELPRPSAVWREAHSANCICVLREKDEERRKEILQDIAKANSFPV